MKNKYTEEDYITYCMSRNLEYIENYKNGKKGTMIKFICKNHRSKGLQEKDWSHLRTYKYGCSYCSGRNKTNEDIIKEMNNDNIILLSDYIGNEKPIDCKCKICGNIWTTQPKVLITNKSGCPKCGRLVVEKSRRKTHNQFVKDIGIVNPTIDIIGKYINSKTNIECKCKECDGVFNATPSNLLNLNTRCPYCNLSKGEKKLLLLLDKYNINYKRQYKLDGCKYKYHLKFDAFDVNNNIAFEFNGEQHYRPVDFCKNDKNEAIKNLEINKIRDNIKIEYCEKHMIPLIIIPYLELNTMESFLLNEFKKRGLYKNIA